MLAIIFVGSSLFMGSQILKNIGYKMIADSILPIASGLSFLWIIWMTINNLL